MSLISLALLTSRAGTLNGPLPCQREDPELWFSEQPADLEQAKAHCRLCPVRGFCLSGAVERREPHGSGAVRSSTAARLRRRRGRGAAPGPRSRKEPDYPAG